MNTIQDLGNAFVKRIARLIRDYSEGRGLFDQYVSNSLKGVNQKMTGKDNASEIPHS